MKQNRRGTKKCRREKKEKRKFSQKNCKRMHKKYIKCIISFYNIFQKRD